MSPQGKAIAAVLKVAGLRPPATLVTDPDGVTRVDWERPNLKEGLARCAAALRAAGFFVETRPTWVCLMVSAQKKLCLEPQEGRVLEFPS